MQSKARSILLAFITVVISLPSLAADSKAEAEKKAQGDKAAADNEAFVQTWISEHSPRYKETFQLKRWYKELDEKEEYTQGPYNLKFEKNKNSKSKAEISHSGKIIYQMSPQTGDAPVWSVAMSDCSDNYEDHCVAVSELEPSNTPDGLKAFDFLHLNSKNRDQSYAVQCLQKSGFDNKRIDLSRCLKYSVSNCISWSSHLNNNKDAYSTVQKGCAVTDADCNKALKRLSSQAGQILRTSYDKDMKTAVMGISRGDTRLRWEPAVSMNSADSFSFNNQDLVQIEAQCQKYTNLFQQKSAAVPSPATNKAAPVR